MKKARAKKSKTAAERGGEGSPDSVADAIEGLYAAFRTYPLRPVVDFCPHCITAAEEKRLHEAPLRQIGSRTLRRFVAKAVTTWGTVNDFKHFLPRIFELAAGVGGFWPDVHELYHKLDRLDWRAWPEAERTALERFSEAYRRARVDGAPACLDR